MNIKQALQLLSTSLLVALSGCGGGGGDSATGTGGGTTVPPAQPPAAYTLAVDSNPLLAVSSTDDARAVTQDLPLLGGSLSATGADGTVYVLTVPADALATAVRIRMTPLATLQIAGLPADRSLGVKLEPEGLNFLQPVTLSITPPAGVNLPVGGQIPVGWSGQSQVVSLAALDPTSSAVNLKLMHFSGYALLFATKGMTASLAAVRHRLGGAAEERIASAIAERLAQERQRQLLGNAEAPVPLDDLRTQFVNDVLKPRLAAAGSSCAAGKLALQTLLGYERQNQLLGLQDDPRYPAPFASLMESTLAASTTACMREEYEICRDEHVLTRILPAFLGVMRQAQLLGIGVSETAPGPAWLQEAEDRVRQCLKFELQFDSSMSYAESSPLHHTTSERVTSRVRIGYAMHFLTPLPDAPQPILDTNALILGNFTALAARDYGVTLNEPCSSLGDTTAIGGSLGVANFGFKPVDPWGARPSVSDFSISLAFIPNASRFSYSTARRNSDGSCGEQTTGSGSENWTSQSSQLLDDAFTTATSGLLVTGWSVNGNSDILATKDVSLRDTTSTSSTNVTVRMVLFHTPER